MDKYLYLQIIGAVTVQRAKEKTHKEKNKKITCTTNATPEQYNTPLLTNWVNQLSVSKIDLLTQYNIGQNSA